MPRSLTTTLLILILLVAVSACGARRVQPFAPRRPDLPAHRGAITNADCLACHKVDKIVDHSPSDDCNSCHDLIPGR